MGTNDRKIELSLKSTVVRGLEEFSKLKMDITVPYQLIEEAHYSANINRMSFNILGMHIHLYVARNKFWNGEGVRQFCERFDKKNKDGMPLCKHEKLLKLLKTQQYGFNLVNADADEPVSERPRISTLESLRSIHSEVSEEKVN